jgi:hypothetical protein
LVCGAALLTLSAISCRSSRATTERLTILDQDGLDASSGVSSPSNSSRVAQGGFLNIPPQCYTRTRDEGGRVYNPCYTCHVQARIPNFDSDQDLQQAYDLPAPARLNPWRNLFADRRAFLRGVSDSEIDQWVRTSNYLSEDGRALLLADALRGSSSSRDRDVGDRLIGFVPDAWFSFDDRGFDHDPDGARTGWRAFAYYPLAGSFFPTNGSADDVLIRLPAEFRERSDGAFDETVYVTNLAIVEALIKRQDVAIDPVDERDLQLDLDGDGRLGKASRVKYDWAPLKKRYMHYVGRARRLSDDVSPPQISAGLFPNGTEFLHSVRYLEVRDDQVRMAPRMKELRYARKYRWTTYGELDVLAQEEAKEKRTKPDRAPHYRGNAEIGLWNGKGWRYQGFIEEASGRLRPQTVTESVPCVGCHGRLGITDDGIFSFSRKLSSSDASRRGWYHWSAQGFEGLAEPRRADGRYEYTHYLETAGAGDEFRSNEEVRRRFFDSSGHLRPDEVAALHGDISRLLVPSGGRARALNKAYLAVVKAQSYAHGRDALLEPATNVWSSVPEREVTGTASSIAAFWKAPESAVVAK